MANFGLALALTEVWGLVTVVLIGLLIHRSILSTREEDQIFLDPAEKNLAAEQVSVIKRMNLLTVPVRTLYAISGSLMVASIVVWLWQGLGGF